MAQPPTPTIIWTHTDEAPALATASLLPIVEAFTAAAGVAVERRDISLAARVLAAFPEALEPDQRVADDLAELGALVRRPEANVIKLPNVSASVPQLVATIAELRDQGFMVPEYPEEPKDDTDLAVKARYDRVKGSAVNPVLREGNSDRRAPASVKAYARSHPHSMGAWSPQSRTDVAHMEGGDFFANEVSVTVVAPATLRIELVDDDGITTVVRDGVAVGAGAVVDATFMSAAALDAFLVAQLERARAADVLFSLHLKATMMKVSDPILFGHAVRAYFAEVFAAHGDTLAAIGFHPDNGIGDLDARLRALPEHDAAAIEADLARAYAAGPALAMVDSDRGITNLHVPSDVIVDASMPAMIRTSGQMWNAAGEQQDTLAVIPDASYAGVYQVVIDDCRAHGAFDPATMGSVPNVGLMAGKAEEYGSHDTTFVVGAAGVVRVVDDTGVVLTEHRVATGDIWRLCRTDDAAVRDWVRLAVTRARVTGAPAVFWLDERRAHDAEIVVKVRETLSGLDTDGLDLRILAPADACALSVERVRAGLDTISVTGNVLRDYLTDLFPILELGTSAKMLSVVPLMGGGGLFETGAGGSAPKHVQQFVRESHLRWDSLGEFLALAASLEHLAVVTGNVRARVLADTLDAATGDLLVEGHSPLRRVHQLDDRGTHAWLATHWARCLADQTDDAGLAATFAPVAEALGAAIDTVIAELDVVQGEPVDIGGYFHPDPELVAAAMRPSPTLNAIVDRLAAAPVSA